MNELFLSVLDHTLKGSFVIVAVIVLRFLIRSKSKHFSCFLWLIAFAALIFPFSIVSKFSLQPDISAYAPSALVQRYQLANAAGEYAAFDTVENELPVFKDETDFSDLQINLFSFENIASFLWCIGMIAMLVWNLKNTWEVKKSFQDRQCLDGRIYETSSVHAPCVFGLFRPNIYLPFHLQEPVKSIVVKHELVHLQRGDIWMKSAAFLIVSVHWMNPLVHLAYYLMIRDMEMSCDEKVISSMPVSRKEYASSLLQMSIHHQNAYLLNCFSQGSVKKRIHHVLSYHRSSLPKTVLLFIILSAVGTALLFSPENKAILSVSKINDLQKLYAYRTDTVSDYRTIISHLDFGTQYDVNAEATVAEIRSDELKQLCIFLNTNQPLSIEQRGSLQKSILYENACALFVLDPTLDLIHYHVKNGDDAFYVICSADSWNLDRQPETDAKQYIRDVCRWIQRGSVDSQEVMFMDENQIFASLEKFIPQAEYKQLDMTILPQAAVSENEKNAFYFFGKLNDSPEIDASYAFDIQITMTKNGISHYTWKDYRMNMSDKQEQGAGSALDDEQAGQLVEQFVKTYRKDWRQYDFRKEDIYSDHRFLKGHVETWKAANELCVIDVDKDKGMIVEASFGLN